VGWAPTCYRAGEEDAMDAKAAARKRIDAARTELVALSRRIHANPELAFEEERASAWLAERLADAGFGLERDACGLPTAFVARKGSGPLHVAVCAEYDALPGIGHACGHNVIAAAAVGAALGLAEVLDEAGLTLSVVGTPAEEKGGGKIILLERGAFQGVHAAMMVHPSPRDVVELPVIAAITFDVRYRGKEAHASAYPELGVNAADALVVAQAAIGLLRQHLRGTDRVHGIVTKGGEAPNIVPALATASFMARAATLAELDGVYARVRRCFEAGALATGASLEIEAEAPYAEMRHDPDIAPLYRRNAEALGRVFRAEGERRGGASTDMGNVSLVIPSIHPAIGIDSLPAVNHQPEFTSACATESADQAVIDGAVAMAWTAIDLASDAALRGRLMGGSPPLAGAASGLA
jgi:amidohydrolase